MMVVTACSRGTNSIHHFIAFIDEASQFLTVCVCPVSNFRLQYGISVNCSPIPERLLTGKCTY